MNTKGLVIFFTIISVLSIASSRPQLGVYAGVAPWGPNNIQNYSLWLNNPVVYAMEFEAAETWDNIAGQGWWLGPWNNWANSAPEGEERHLIISIPMIPSLVEGVSIATGAQGAYNQYFQTLGENLVKFNLSTALLRIGWEFNGDWYKWTALPGCNYWAPYYAQIVTTMRAVPGNNFKTIWNPNGGYNTVNAPDCWPGDEYVDYVGVDSYDIDYGTYNWESTQPFGSWSPTRLSVINDSVEHNVSIWKALVNSTNVEPGTDDTVWTLLANSTTLQSLRQKAWNTVHSGYLGLEFWANFARNHSKPLILNEWGVWANVRGGFDNDYYIERMHEFIMNETKNVAIYSYFDVLAFDGDHRLRPETNFPRASQKFWELFGVHEQPSPDANSPSDQNSPNDSNGEVPSSSESPQAKPAPSSQLRSGSTGLMYYIPAMIVLVLLVL